MEIKGKNYRERCNYQLKQWVDGNSIHNKIDDECCPDFSCCIPQLKQPKEIRETFKAVCDKGDEDTEMGMLMDFLGKGAALMGQKDVYITDGDTNRRKEEN